MPVLYISFFLFILFIYWLCWILLHGLFSNCSERGPLSRCSALASLCGAWALGREGFGSFVSWAQQLVSRTLEHRLNNCSTWASLLPSMWDLWDQGSNSCLLHWQANSFNSEPPGKPQYHLFLIFVSVVFFTVNYFWCLPQERVCFGQFKSHRA